MPTFQCVHPVIERCHNALQLPHAVQVRRLNVTVLPAARWCSAVCALAAVTLYTIMDWHHYPPLHAKLSPSDHQPSSVWQGSTNSGGRVRDVPRSLCADQAIRRHLRPCPWRRAVVTFACEWSNDEGLGRVKGSMGQKQQDRTPGVGSIKLSCDT